MFYNAVQAAKRRIIAAGYADGPAKPNAGGSMREAIERIEAEIGAIYIVGEQGPEMFTPDPPDA